MMHVCTFYLWRAFGNPLAYKVAPQPTEPAKKDTHLQYGGSLVWGMRRKYN